jgi:hypothetical protein
MTQVFEEIQTMVNDQMTAPPPAPAPVQPINLFANFAAQQQAQPAPASAAPKPPKVAAPEPFDGTIERTERFISACELYFMPGQYTNRQKITFALSYMSDGRAELWACQYLKKVNDTTDWDDFTKDLRESFGDANPSATARHKIRQLYQGSRPVDEYIVDFEQWEALTEYNDKALSDEFKRGLHHALLRQIFSLPSVPSTLAEWKKWSCQFYRQYQELKVQTREGDRKDKGGKTKEKKKGHTKGQPSLAAVGGSSSTFGQQTSTPAPIEIKKEADARSVSGRKCFVCGSTEHFAKWHQKGKGKA